MLSSRNRLLFVQRGLQNFSSYSIMARHFNSCYSGRHEGSHEPHLKNTKAAELVSQMSLSILVSYSKDADTAYCTTTSGP